MKKKHGTDSSSEYSKTSKESSFVDSEVSGVKAKAIGQKAQKKAKRPETSSSEYVSDTNEMGEPDRAAIEIKNNNTIPEAPEEQTVPVDSGRMERPMHAEMDPSIEEEMGGDSYQGDE